MAYQLPIYALLYRPRWPFVLCSFIILLGILLAIALLIASHGLPFLLLAPLGQMLLSSIGAGGSLALCASLMLTGTLGISAERLQPNTLRQFFVKLGLAGLNFLTFGFLRNRLPLKNEIYLMPGKKIDSAKIFYVLPDGQYQRVTFLKDPAKHRMLFFITEDEIPAATSSTTETKEFLETNKKSEN